MQRRGELWFTQLGLLASENIKKPSFILNKNSANVLARGCGKGEFVQSLLYVDEIGDLRKVCGNTSGPSLVRHPGGMVLWAAILILQGAGFVGSITGVPGVPENITVMFLNPTSVRVSWSTSQVNQVEKYDVTYKPTDARNETIDAYDAMYNETYNQTFVLSYNEPYNETYNDERMVRLVAGNSDAVTLTDLQADTQYQLVITAVRSGKKYRSRPIVFRTLEPPRTSPQQDGTATGGPIPPPPPPPPPSAQQPHAYIQVRGVEVGIVVMVLIVWAGAIALFFNRWGKIRMLLPYQPDYKEQLKVPGTGVCAATTTTCTQHSSQHACSQHLHWSSHRVDSLDSAACGGGGTNGGLGLGWSRSPRPRINSAIDVAGFLSQEFLRRHGSTSRLCRKVRSADNLPLASCSNHQDNDHRNSNDEDVQVDREAFLQTTNDDDDKIDDTESKRQSSLESTGMKDNAEISLLEPHPQQSTSRECGSSTIITATSPPSLVTKRMGGWRVGGSHEYVKCPVRQASVIDERFHRHSCEPDFTRPQHHQRRASPISHIFHHESVDGDSHSRSRDYSRYTAETSVETQHFGLPILSISEPSPPDERDRLDDYL